jgi:hypothetical protein
VKINVYAVRPNGDVLVRMLIPRYVTRATEAAGMLLSYLDGLEFPIVGDFDIQIRYSEGS